MLHIFRERLNIQIYLIMGEASLISYFHNKEFLEYVRDRDAITLNDAIY